MLASERFDYIRKELNKKGVVNVTELEKVLKVSTETVRRDLLKMEELKLLKRVHGGAVSINKMKSFETLTVRNKENYSLKLSLSKMACSTILDGDVIAIDSGSTAIVFAEELKKRFTNLTIVTHSLDVFNLLARHENFKVILIAGHFLESENAFYGDLVLDSLSKIRVSKAYIFPGAISLDGGACDFCQDLLQVQRKYLSVSSKIYLLADSSKIEKNALIQLDSLKPEYTVITDGNLLSETFNLYRENGIDILLGE